jgi:hypothetical protein
MSHEPDYILDISGLNESQGSDSASGPAGRKWIGVKFECCGAYSRIYRNRQGSAYEGFCPKCTARIQVPIGPGGTNQRMFRAS